MWMRTARGVIMDSQCIREEASRMGWFAQIVNIPMKQRMEELIKQLVDLSEDRVLQDGLILDTLHETRRLKFHIPGRLAGLAFVSHFDQIWAWLVQDGVQSIGIYGLGGVGKTTLAKCVFNKALERRNPIQNVLWIDSSQIVEVRDLQVAIAKPLHLDISAVDDEAVRATLLSKTLKRKRECIVFLDGMYADISPDDVGIPLKKSRCRLIVTSRSIDVPRKMGCEKIIEMKPLVNEEDWSLFTEKLGGGRDLDPEIQRIAKLIVKKCSGIPLAIIVMATSMRGVVDICEWKNALNELEKSPIGGLNNDMEKKVLPVLRLSFDRLNDSELQQCFLMCALLYPNEMYRKDLICYLISTGSMRRMQNWKEDFERGCTIINRLVGSCLLTDEYSYGEELSMNGLIRDMVINVLKTSPDIMVKVFEIPEEKEWTENLKMAYLFLDHMISISQLGASPTCSKLRTLVCRRRKQSPYMPDSLPDSFFLYMPALETLDLSYTCIECLPSSFSSLKNLTALLLQDCRRLKYVPSLKEVESLKFLDASGSGIIEIPDFLERLVNLIYLNLSSVFLLPVQVFPLGILPKLTKLEYLKVTDNLTVEGRELEGLERLSTFSGRLSSLHSYNSYVMSRQYHGPKDYEFSMGFREAVKEKANRDLNCVDVSHCRISKRGRLPIVLPKDVEVLGIRFCTAVTSLCDVPSLENAMGLKECFIRGCNDVSHVACCSSSCHLCRSHTFQTLEELRLHRLPQLSAICGFDDINGKASTPVIIAPGTFSCLKKFVISNCPKMKILFQLELLPYLQNLEEIKVFNCERLEEIIEAASSSSNNCEYSLPKLRRLELGWLPNLQSIFKGRITCDALEEIRNCPELKRIPLSPPPSSLRSIIVSDCPELKRIPISPAKNDLQHLVQFKEY